MSKAEKIRALRREGAPLREIASALGVSVGRVCHALYTRPPLRETSRSIVKRVPVLGCQGHMSCYYQPVSLPRLRFLEVAHG